MNRYKSWLRLVFAAVCLVGILAPAKGDIILWDEGTVGDLDYNPLSNVFSSHTPLPAITQAETYHIIGQATRNSSNIPNPQGFDFMSFSLDPLLEITSAVMELTATDPLGSTMLANVQLYNYQPMSLLGGSSSVASGGGSEELLGNGGALNLESIGPGTYRLWIGNNGSDFSTVDYMLTLLVIPEPASLFLLYAGVIGLLLQRPFRYV